MKTKEEIEAGLAGFYGTEQYHRFSILFKNHVLTDGVKWLCENAGCYWLVEAIASHHVSCMRDPKDMLQNMQFWTLKRNKTGRGAKLICERDTGDIAITQKIPYTDFPLPEIKLYCQRADEKTFVIMLVNEY